MYQNFGTGEEQASNYDSPSRGGRQVRFQPINQSEALATVMEGSSDASSPTGSPSSGESLSQLGRNDQAAQQGVRPACFNNATLNANVKTADNSAACP
jgi:hypothetical protein